MRALRLLILTLCFGLASVEMVSAQARATAARYVCPMHAEVTSSKPGKCPRCEMALVAASPLKGATKRRKLARRTRTSGSVSSVSSKPATPPAAPLEFAALSAAERIKELERLAPTYDYSCPMHPDVHQAQEGVCPKCGMILSSIKPSIIGEYQLKLISLPQSPKVGEKVRLRFIVSEPQTGALVNRFVVNHEKLFHLFIISQDMADYQHIHPQLEPDGSFVVETVLPRTGLYKLHSDFFPIGGTSQVIHKELMTAGYNGRTRSNAKPAPAPLTPDATLSKTIDGMKVELMLGGGNGNSPVAGLFVPLKYRLTDAQTGQPVQDLEPYLGAWGHTLILNADQSEYLHSHPTEMLPGGTNRASMHGGPEVEFGAMFPAAGNYRIWTQFQRGGKIVTVSFTIRVR